MAYCSSYYLYQRYEKRGDQDWIPSYPNVYSIDGEGSKPLRARQMYDTDCGWIPDTEPIYRWTEITPTSDPNSYWCDNCPLTNIKLSANYSDSTTYTVDCNSSTTLSETEVKGHSTPYSSMTSAEIGNCVTNIDEYAFYICSGLTSCTIGDSVTSIGSQAFFRCSSLTSVNMPSGLTSIGNDAFTYCSGLTSIDIPSGVTSIGNGTFQNCSSLTSVNMPRGLTSIGNWAFGYCNSLTSIDIPSGVTSIGNYTFSYCRSLTSCTIGSGVTSIGYDAFTYCSGLTSIDIPDSVTSIGEGAFYHCSSLTSCTIGSGVTSIGNAVFNGCSSLTSITVNATNPPTLGGNVFDNTNNCPIYVPCESVEAYKSATNWSDYASRIQGIEPCYSYSGQYLTFEALDSGTFSFSGSSSSTIDNSSIQYSTNSGQSWNTLNRGNSISVSSGQKVYFKSSTLTPIGFVSGVGTFGIGRFLTTGRFNVEGNIMSLLYGDNFQNQTSLAEKEYAFYSLFSSGCTGLTSAENLVLPATTLAKSCYRDMFGYCTSLTTVPNLPATTLAENCYSWMYGNCSGLTTVSSNYLPATTLAKSCYSSMFCRTSLTSVPNLPATTLAESCYNGMFDQCKLTSVPSNYLPVTTLANLCYMWMFAHNESLTVAPDLPATTLQRCCYQYMFYGCTSLNYIKCLATNISADNSTKEWVKNVSSSGTFVKKSGTTWPSGISGIPSGWTIQNA